MKEKQESINNLIRDGNTYKLKIDDVTIEMQYSENNKKFNECILNILKQKINKE